MGARAYPGAWPLSTLAFDLKPLPGPDRAASAWLTVRLDGTPIWPSHGEADAAIDIPLDDLLSQLAAFWQPLLLEQTYPLALNPDRPGALRAEARRRWTAAPAAQAAAEDEILESFQDAHDLSRAFGGLYELPPFWLMRCGDSMAVDTDRVEAMVPFPHALAVLTELGDTLAKRLRAAGETRWGALLDAWSRRGQAEPIQLLAWTTGLAQDRAATLAADGLLTAPDSLDAALIDDDPLRLAARMAGALPPPQLCAVLARVRLLPPVAAPGLEELAAAARALFALLDAPDLAPYEQGVRIAGLARGSAGLDPDAGVDVFSFCRQLGIAIHTEPLEPDTLDALAIAGGGHGPAVLLNPASRRHTAGRRHTAARHPAGNGSLRVSLAHELCHLLADARPALAAVEILQSRMPARVEQRARAFAAEFLLPAAAAARVWSDQGQPTEREGLAQVIDRLCRRFGVTRSVAAWKLQHGAAELGADLEAMLTEIVPQR